MRYCAAALKGYDLNVRLDCDLPIRVEDERGNVIAHRTVIGVHATAKQIMEWFRNRTSLPDLGFYGHAYGRDRWTREASKRLLVVIEPLVLITPNPTSET
jgi:hypothetical protein